MAKLTGMRLAGSRRKPKPRLTAAELEQIRWLRELVCEGAKDLPNGI